MRTTGDGASVRLYRLDAESGATATLLYGPLSAALAMAADQPSLVRAELFIQTDNDVIAYADLVEE